MAFRIGIIRPPGIDDGAVRQRLIGRLVVVGDDHVDGERSGVGDLCRVGAAAVGGDEQRCTAGGDAVQRLAAQAACVFQAVRDEVVELRAGLLEFAQCACEQGGGGYAIGVEVAINGDVL